MDSDKDWEQTQLQVERIQSQTNEAKKGWIGVQGKTIKSQYGEEKAKTIINARTASGLYYNDDLFPEDEDDTCHIMTIYKFSLLTHNWHFKRDTTFKYEFFFLQIISEERWYYMRTSQKFTQKDTCTDLMTLKASSSIDHGLRQALVDPDTGILKPGCMPQVATATAAGSKQLLDAISKAPPKVKS